MLYLKIMNKKEVLQFITEHNKEYRGKLVTQCGFKKHFPELYDEMIKVNFPSYFDTFDFKQKLWHFLRDDYDLHLCKCGGELKFRSFWYGYNKFCKPNCPAMIENQIKHVKDKNDLRTNEEKQEIQNKVKNTFLLKYGVERYSQTKEWKEQTIKKNKEKFGKDWYTQTEEYKVNFEKYCEEKYGEGIINPFQDEKIKNIIHEKFYDNFLKKHPEVIEIKNNILVCRCCDDTCTLCNDKIYEIDKVTFSNRKCKNIDTCTIRNGYGNISSCVENILYDYIKSIYDGNIIRNERNILRGKEIDIYLPELSLGFEFNGIYWHGELYKDKKYHQNKTLSCMNKGIQLIQIWEDDWIDNNDVIKDFIKSKLNRNKISIGARKCDVKEISNTDAYNFLQLYHLQGGIKNGKSLGLFFNDELVEVMTFGQLRKNMGNKPKEGYYEIYRLCSKGNYNIQGGFGKLLKYFEKHYNPIEIITYANLDYSYGNVYKKTGFEEKGISSPTYTWVVNNKRRHRSNFSKSKLQECKTNPGLTEVEVMYNRGCWRCWDSGKIKFVKNIKEDE